MSLSPKIVLEEKYRQTVKHGMRSSKITINYWKSISQENQSAGKLVREEQRRVQDASLFPVYYGSAKGPWHSTVDGCGDRAVPTDWGTGAPPYAAAFSRWRYTDCGQRLKSICGYTAERCACAGYGGPPGEKAENHRDAYSPSKGEIVRTDTAYQWAKLLSFPATA